MIEEPCQSSKVFVINFEKIYLVILVLLKGEFH